MIETVAFNGVSISIDSRLQEYESMQAPVNFIVYNQFLKQLHLPCEKWKYQKGGNGTILLEKQAELYVLDAILFKELDYSKLVRPLQLYTYFLLQEFLGNGLNYQGLGIINEKKTRVLYLDTDFNLSNREYANFKTNDLSRFIIRKAKYQELLNAHETFFVLIDEKFKVKLLNALTLHQAETAVKVDKIELVEHLFEANRLAKLKAFSQNLIERK